MNSLSAQPIVINTRPVERAAPLTRHLQAAGFTVVDMPMLALQTRAITAIDLDIMRAWLTGEYQALVIVSPTAAASGLTLWQMLNAQLSHQDFNKDSKVERNYSPKKINADVSLSNDINNESSLATAPSPIIAVGSATAEVIQQTTASCLVLQPTIANNEGMLAMPEIAALQAGDKLLIWRGLGGRRLLVDSLQSRGVIIDSIAWYERTMPDNAVADYLNWWQQRSSSLKPSSNHLPRPLVIISSGSAFEHWQQVVNQVTTHISQATTHNPTQANIPRLVDFIYVVLGERLANKLAEQRLDHLRVENLLPTTILVAINNAN